ncbi:hypothetical protein TRAPUB_8051 [Trametes pubescens]|uniref:Uncharacterized protein n=1 Tax=Trametes pubescens TaxID=154538 RepID=A0A1M2W684_TRAPU|nr:hypothetical protein TRAPUB_8051 [Trametes pubescens]
MPSRKHSPKFPANHTAYEEPQTRYLFPAEHGLSDASSGTSNETTLRQLEAVEARCDARHLRTNEDLEHLSEEYTGLATDVRALRREQTAISKALAHFQDEMLELRNILTELATNFGTSLSVIRENTRKEQRSLNVQVVSLRDEFREKVGQLEVDGISSRSQRTVDRTQVERVQHAMVVLEASNSSLLKDVRRVESRIEDLQDAPCFATDGPPLCLGHCQCCSVLHCDQHIQMDSERHRTLAEEFTDSGWPTEAGVAFEGVRSVSAISQPTSNGVEACSTVRHTPITGALMTDAVTQPEESAPLARPGKHVPLEPLREPAPILGEPSREPAPILGEPSREIAPNLGEPSREPAPNLGEPSREPAPNLGEPFYPTPTVKAGSGNPDLPLCFLIVFLVLLAVAYGFSATLFARAWHLVSHAKRPVWEESRKL